MLALYRRYKETLDDGEEPLTLNAYWRNLRAAFKDEPNSEEAPMTVVEYLAARYRHEKGADAVYFPKLEQFARACRMQGEKVVSVETVYELNDRYYGQWAAMNVPFRSLDELVFEDIERRVPGKYRYLASALRLCSDQSR
eukprot:9502601-Pyramimonas_sp.AAC.1